MSTESQLSGKLPHHAKQFSISSLPVLPARVDWNTEPLLIKGSPRRSAKQRQPIPEDTFFEDPVVKPDEDVPTRRLFFVYVETIVG